MTGIFVPSPQNISHSIISPGAKLVIGIELLEIYSSEGIPTQRTSLTANPVPKVSRGPKARKIDNSPKPLLETNLSGLALQY